MFLSVYLDSWNKKLSYQIGLLNKLFKKGFGGIFYEK